MAGLLSDVLPWVYSKGNQARQQLNRLVSDPIGAFESAAQTMQGNHQKLQGLLDQAQAGNQQAQGDAAEMALGGLLGFAPVGMTVWHGSPHVFNKFDSSKIGTGEGAQVYGHGLYVAEAPEVAKQYATGLTARSKADFADDVTLRDKMWLSEQLRSAAEKVGQDVGSPAATYTAINYIAGAPLQLSPGGKHALELLQQELSPEAVAFIRSKVRPPQGMLYKADLADPAVPKFLDYDKPLSQQTVPVQESLRPLIEQVLAMPPRNQGVVRANSTIAEGAATGGDLMRRLDFALSQRKGAFDIPTHDPASTAQGLRTAGIPGVRYLDGQSRGVGGTSNFVVFPGEEGLLNILERNGQPLR